MLFFYLAFGLIGLLVLAAIAYLWRSISNQWPWEWLWRVISKPNTEKEGLDSHGSEELSREEFERIKKWIKSSITNEVDTNLKSFKDIPGEVQKIQKEIRALQTSLQQKNDGSLHRLDKNEGNLHRIDKKLQEIEKDLRQIRRRLENQSDRGQEKNKIPERPHNEYPNDSYSQDNEPYHFPKQAAKVIESVPSIPPPARKRSTLSVQVPSELIHSYNRGVVDTNDRDTFQTRYKPIRVKTANAMKRREDPNLPPEFHTHHAGDYYAVEFEEGGQKRYAVLPRFGLTFDAVSFGPGAIGEVFDCDGYDSGLKYHQAKVIQPAIFEPEGDQGWRLVAEGELDLGQGE
ncbi:MAG: hypothetical protein V7641_1787 [Blastocatellia bacterium]